MSKRPDADQDKDRSWADFQDFWEWYELAEIHFEPEPDHYSTLYREDY